MTMAQSPDGFSLSWAGECSAWECDELGHLNMRHYVTKFSEARQFFLIHLGLVNAFRPKAHSTIRTDNLHIKYLGEARPGDPLKIHSGILSIDPQSLHLCHLMYHHDGRLAASLTETVSHIYLRNRQSFNWPKRVLNAARALYQDCQNTPPLAAPLPALPRNLDLSQDQQPISAQDFTARAIDPIGAGVFKAEEMSAAGFAPPQAIFGRATSSMGWFEQGWPELFDADYRQDHGSAAVLEIAARFYEHPRQGQPYEFRVAMTKADSYTRNFVQAFHNPITGQCYSLLRINGCLFNLKTRRLTQTSPEQLSHMQSDIHHGL